MTTAPTEEMRERAREIIAALAYDPDVKGKDAELVARALAEQDRLAVERCAKLAEAEADYWADGYSEVCLDIAAALRAQGEK